MAREIRNNAFSNQSNDPGSYNTENANGLAGAEMADRGPKNVSGITGREDDAETRPVTHMFAEPSSEGGGDEDYDDEDEDLDLDDDDLDDEDGLVSDDDDDVEIDETLDEDVTDDDLLLDDDDDDDDDDDL